MTRLRFENSWGGIGDSGHHTMSAAWFKEYVYHVAVDARFLPSKVLAALDLKDGDKVVDGTFGGGGDGRDFAELDLRG